MMTKTKAHEHAYVQYDGRGEFATCSACGFTAPKRLILRYGMVLDRQLSESLLAERREIEASIQRQALLRRAAKEAK